MKKFLFLSVLLISSLSVFAGADLYYVAVDKASGELASYIGVNETVAFVSLESENLDFGETYMRDFEKALLNKSVTIVERRNIEPLVEEYRFEINGFVSNEKAVSIGNMAGCDLIITGSARNMVSNLRVELALTDVETGTVRYRIESKIKYDTFLDNLINEKTGIGNQKFNAYVKLGAGFEINQAHEDMIGTALPRPTEKSLTSFVPAFGFGYNFAGNFGVNLELAYYVNNGIKVINFYDEYSGYNTDIDVSYKSIDVPLYLEWRFIRRPVTVALFAGGYISIPKGDGNITFKLSDQELSGAIVIDGPVFGLLGGFNVGIPAGPGVVLADVRYFRDFDCTRASCSSLGIDNEGLIQRSGINVSVGYRFSLDEGL